MTDEHKTTSDPDVGSTRLLACPWCGETPEAVRPYAAPSIVRILCRSGDCTVNPSVSGYTYERAAAKWNKRKANKTMSATILNRPNDLKRKMPGSKAGNAGARRNPASVSLEELEAKLERQARAGDVDGFHATLREIDSLSAQDRTLLAILAVCLIRNPPNTEVSSGAKNP